MKTNTSIALLIAVVLISLSVTLSYNRHKPKTAQEIVYSITKDYQPNACEQK